MITCKKIDAIRLFVLCVSLFMLETVRAQLVFTPDSHDFGTVEEAGGVVRCRFRGVNQGKKPVVLLDVVTTCGCTVPTFSRKPIPAGGETEIEVSYDPYGRPGLFERKLRIYGTDRRELAVLTIRGTVSPRARSVEELYPTAACGGVRLSGSLATFTYIYTGAPMQTALSLINTADEPRTLELRPRRESGLLTLDYPRQLAAGERSAINLRYRVDASAPRYGTIRDALEVWIDGRRCDEVLLVAHGIGIDRPTEAVKAAPPVADFGERVVRFGTVKHGAPLQRRQLTLRNTGRSPLMVRAVECNAPFGVTAETDRPIAPGESCTIGVTLDPSQADYGITTTQLLVVTNDPEHPAQRIRLTAIVEG